MSADLAALLYLLAGVLFILALRGLSNPETSRRGNLLGMTGMTIAIATTLAWHPPASFSAWVLVVVGMALGGGAGAVIARRVPMTAMPELVAAFHSLVGLAAVLVAAGALYAPEAFGIGTEGAIRGQSLIEMSLGVAIGAVTFTGSVIAFLKLSGRMSGKPIILPLRHVINIALGLGLIALIVWFFQTQEPIGFWSIAGISFLLGVLIIVPIGGADMPVVISMLNSYSGWAAAGIGFTLENTALIITGALVGSSGAILSYIMCKGMNRSFISVILGGFGGEVAGPSGGAEHKPVKLGSAEDAAYILKNSSKVIIVPGYGMAVAQAQHALREMAEKLKAEGVEVKYAIHPVAGRMPGHMNVLLAEANVPYDEVFELEDINSEFPQADVAYVIGANDVTNPAAEDDPKSPIYGMPVLQVWKAGTVMFNKRSLASGYAGIDNPLFYRDNTMMLLGDAKKMTEQIAKDVREQDEMNPDRSPIPPSASRRARSWRAAGQSATSPYRFLLRLIGIPIIAVAAVFIYRGVHDRFALPECDSAAAKSTLSQVLKQLKLEPARYTPIKTISSSDSEVVCAATLPLPDGASVVANFTFYWQGDKANMNYSIHRQAPQSSTGNGSPGT